jgi:hypothetical protein
MTFNLSVPTSKNTVSPTLRPDKVVEGNNLHTFRKAHESHKGSKVLILRPVTNKKLYAFLSNNTCVKCA